jgi:hypothetical protein
MHALILEIALACNVLGLSTARTLTPAACISLERARRTDGSSSTIVIAVASPAFVE